MDVDIVVIDSTNDISPNVLNLEVNETVKGIEDPSSDWIIYHTVDVPDDPTSTKISKNNQEASVDLQKLVFEDLIATEI